MSKVKLDKKIIILEDVMVMIDKYFSHIEKIIFAYYDLSGKFENTTLNELPTENKKKLKETCLELSETVGYISLVNSKLNLLGCNKLLNLIGKFNNEFLREYNSFNLDGMKLKSKKFYNDFYNNSIKKRKETNLMISELFESLD